MVFVEGEEQKKAKLGNPNVKLTMHVTATI